MSKTRITRRKFVASTAATVGAASLLGPLSRVRGANDDIRIAVVGVGSQGSGHAGRAAGTAGARLVAVCDPD